MAGKGKKKEVDAIEVDDMDDFSTELIKSMNKEMGDTVAYNLGVSESPTHVKWWISTGSKLLDYIISNRPEGGAPSGRIIELAGMPSTGKSHIAFQMARTIQRQGGLVVYIDTENATPIEKLHQMGIDVKKRFVYCDSHMTEEVFTIMESTIRKAGNLAKKSIPILVVWDSVAATSPKAELEGEYDENTIGLQARVISKGMRKITGLIGQNNVTLLCCNQLRTKIGVMFGDPMTTPGGMSIPFHASVRMQLHGGGKLEDKNGNVIGSKATLKTIKNKVAPNFRSVSFNILFGQGIDETDAIFETIVEGTKDSLKEKKTGIPIGDGGYITLEGAQWRYLKHISLDGEVLQEKKFQKAGFSKVQTDEYWGPLLDKALESIMVLDYGVISTEDIQESEEE